MIIITFKTNSNIVDSQVENLMMNDIFNVYYESPLNITTNMWGYGFEEKENEPLNLNIVFDGDKTLLDDFTKNICKILNLSDFTLKNDTLSYEEVILPEIKINDSYSLLHPALDTDAKNRINFISQGAFGTGLHETTKDILSYILNKDFTDMSVMDIGTGSGILSIATAIKNAKKVTAIDIRNVKEEVLLNANLNALSNIEIKIGNALTNDFEVDNLYDAIYINIGGEETIMFMDYISAHLKENGFLLVSGLVSWSFDYILENIKKYNFSLEEKLQTNEWCTAIFKK